MSSEERYKGRIIIGVGQRKDSLVILALLNNRTCCFNDIEEMLNDEISCIDGKLANLETGLHEVDIDYYAWEESNESGFQDGDNELKILSHKEIDLQVRLQKEAERIRTLLANREVE